MYFLYNVGLFLILVLAAPYLFYQAIVHKKYLANLSARLGLRPLTFSFPINKPVILIHCVSVGEFLAAEVLIEQIHKNLLTHQIIITTTTTTGQQLAKERVSKFAEVCYFPLDFTFSVKKFFSQVKPVAIVVMETEIWPQFFRVASENKVPILIANGRISDRSFPRYKLLKFFLAKTLSLVTKFLMQSTQDAERILALGAPANSVLVCGNIKYDFGTEQQAKRLDLIASKLDKLLNLSQNTPLLVFGSTTPGEEGLLLAAYQKLLQDKTLANTRLLIVPRRPERFTDVANLLAIQDIKFTHRSKIDDSSDNNQIEQVILLDSIGELAAVYRFATVVFVGGSLLPYGGHNILEPALYQRAIITGAYMSNFHQIIKDFLAAKAVIQLPALEKQELISEIAEKLSYLLKNESANKQLGENAYQVIAKNRGALTRQLEVILDVIKNK